MNNKIRKKFSSLYDKNVDGIYRFIYFKVSSEEIAQDLTSEAFLKSWEVFQREAEKIENPRAFIYRVARNLVIDYYRKKDRTQTLPIEELFLIDPKQKLEESVLIKSDFEQVKKALVNLNDNYQTVISLYYIEGMPTKEISKIMKKSEGAIRVLLHRALSSLRQKVEEV